MPNLDTLEAKKLYTAVSNKFDIGTFDEFASKMGTTEERSRFYNAVQEKGFDLGDINTYENRLVSKNTQESTVSNLASKPVQPNVKQPFNTNISNENVKALAQQYGISDTDLDKLANATPEQVSNITGLTSDKVTELQSLYKQANTAIPKPKSIIPDIVNKAGYTWASTEPEITTKPIFLKGTYTTNAPVGVEQFNPEIEAISSLPEKPTIEESKSAMYNALNEYAKQYGASYVEDNGINPQDLDKLFPEGTQSITKAQLIDAVSLLKQEKSKEIERNGNKFDEYVDKNFGSDWEAMKESYGGEVLKGIASSIKQVKDGVLAKSPDQAKNVTDILSGSISTIFQLIPAAQVFMGVQKAAEVAESGIEAAVSKDPSILSENKGKLSKILNFSMTVPNQVLEYTGAVKRTPEGSWQENVAGLFDTVWQLMLLHGAGKTIKKVKGLGAEKYTKEKLYEATQDFAPLAALSDKIIKKEEINKSDIQPVIDKVSEIVDNPENIKEVIDTEPNVTDTQKQIFSDNVEYNKQLNDLTVEEKPVEVLDTETTPQEVINTVETGNVTDINGLIDQTQLELAKTDEAKTGETVTPENLAETNKIPIENVETQKETQEKGLQEVVTKPQEQTPAVTTPIEEGAVVEMPSQMKGGLPRKFIFSEGTWKQEVGGSLTEVSDNVKQQAENAYRLKQQTETKPLEEKQIVQSSPAQIEQPSDISVNEFINNVEKYSNNPNDIKQAYDLEIENNGYNSLNYWQKAIIDNGANISRESFIKFNDVNNINNTLARRFLKKNGKPLDTFIEEDLSGMLNADEVRDMPTPSEVAQFLVDVTSGVKSSRKQTDLSKRLAGKYKEITGKNINQHVQDKTETSLQEIPEDVIHLLKENNKDIDSFNTIEELENFIEGNKDLFINEFPYSKESYNQIKNFIENEKSKYVTEKTKTVSENKGTGEKIIPEPKQTEQVTQDKATKLQIARENVKTDLDQIFSRIISKQNIVPEERQPIIELLKRTLVDIGTLTAEEVKSFVRNALSGYKDKIKEEEIISIENELSMDKDIVGETGTPKNEIKQAETLTTSETGVPTPSASKLSGIKKSLVSDEIISKVNIDKISDEEMIKLGGELRATGEIDARNIVEEITSGNHRALQPKEVVSLINYKVELDNKLDSVYDKISKANKEGANADELNAQALILEKQIRDYEEMSVITAQQQSLAFRLRQGLLNRTYELANQIKRYKAKSKDGTIPADIEKLFRETDEKLRNVQKELNEEQKKSIELEKKLVEKNIKEETKRNKKIVKKEKQLESDVQEYIESNTFKEWIKKAEGNIDNLIEQTRKDILQISYGQASVNALPIQLAQMAKLTALYMAKGGLKITDAISTVYDEFKDSFKDITKDDIEKAIKAELKKEIKPSIDKNGNIKIPESYLRNLIEDGKETIEEWTNDAKNILSNYNKDITETEVRDAITKYGKKTNLTRDEIKTKILEQKNIGKLISKIRDVKEKNKIEKNVVKKRELSDREKKLTDELNTLLEEKGIIYEERLKVAEKNSEKAIKDLKARIETQNFAKGRYDINGNFIPLKKRAVLESEKLKNLNSEKVRLQEIFEKEQYANELRNRPLSKKLKDWVIEAFATTRMIAGIDMSVMAIQGFMRSVINPKTVPTAFKESMKQLASEKEYFNFINKIKSSDIYSKIKQSGGYLSEPSLKFTAREEQYQSGWVNIIWDALGKYTVGLGKKDSKAADIWSKLNPYKAGQRAFEGYLNVMRLKAYEDYFNYLKSQGKTIENDPKSYKAVATWVNNSTGRGKIIGQLEGAADILTLGLFSPRKIAADFNVVNPRFYYKLWKKSPTVAKRSMRDMLKFVGVVGTTLTMANLAGKINGDDEPVVELDPRSSNFLKIRVGNKHIDILSGKAQILSLFARFYKEEIINKEGKVEKLGARYGSPTRYDLVSNFFRGKASPSAGIALRYLDSRINEKTGVRKDPFGEEITLKNEIERNTLPIWTQSIKEIYEEGDPTVNSGLLFLNFLGFNVTVPKNKKKFIKRNGNLQGTSISGSSLQGESVQGNKLE